VRTKSLRFLFIFLFSVMASLSGFQSNAQSIEETLKQKVNSFELENVTLRRCFEELTARYDFVIGFESLPELPNQSNTINVKLENGTVRDVLDALIAQDPRYRWSASEQAINVHPIVGNQTWMTTVIGHFKVDNVNRYEALDALLNSREIQTQFARAPFRRGELRSLPGVADSDLLRFSLDLQNATPRSILNAIAKADHSGVWMYVRYGKNSEYFSIIFTNLMTRIYSPSRDFRNSHAAWDASDSDIRAEYSSGRGKMTWRHGSYSSSKPYSN
jgi:hypothetical protein